MIKMINELTKKTFEETDKNMNIIECETVEEMFKKLGIDSKYSDSRSNKEICSHPSPRRRRTEDEV